MAFTLRGRSLREVILISVLGGLLLSLVTPSWRPIGIAHVSGTSMLPTIEPGGNYLFARWATPNAGDIVLAHAEGELLIKRIIYTSENKDGKTVFTLMGDNRDVSCSVRVSREQIVGVVYPVKLWGDKNEEE